MGNRKTLIGQFVLLLASMHLGHSQEVGHYLQGSAGLDSGSAPPPGIYFVYSPYLNFVDAAIGPAGNVLARGNLTIGVHNLAVSLTTKKKIFGAEYGATLVAPFVNQRLQADVLPTGSAQQGGLSDIYVAPIVLGWHRKTADYVINYGFMAPTGNFNPAAPASAGLGFWTHQFQDGLTYHLDKANTWNAAVLSTWEIHTRKSGIDVTPGPGVTIEYGLGKKLFHYRLNVGVSGFYYQKLFSDSGSDIAPGRIGLRDRALGLGPEAQWLIPKAKLSFLLRYQPEFGLQSRLRGSVLVLGITYLHPFSGN